MFNEGQKLSEYRVSPTERKEGEKSIFLPCLVQCEDGHLDGAAVYTGSI